MTSLISTHRKRIIGSIVTAILLLGLGFHHASTQSEYRAAIQAIREAGGRFGYDYENYGGPVTSAHRTWVPVWLQRLIGSEWHGWFHHVDYIHLEGNRATDETLAAISKLPKVTLISLWGNDTVTEKGYGSVGQMKSLTWLSLQHSRLNDVGMAQLTSLNRLQKLELNNTLISDKSVPLFKNYPSLKELWIEDSKISKAAGRDLEKALPKTMVTY